MATKSKSNDKDDAPLIDLNEASVKKLIAKAKKRGYVTYDELNDALPQGEMSSDQIEDIQSALSDMGVQIVESDEDAEAAEDAENEVEEIASSDSDDDSKKAKKTTAAAAKKTTTGERTDDPVRMYLREMGAVELLSREGEIAIAKRIEAGRDMMIMGLCQSPITFHAIILAVDGLDFIIFILIGFDDVHAHLGDGGHDVLDLIGAHLVRRQGFVHLIIGEDPAPLAAGDELLDLRIVEVDQRLVAVVLLAFVFFRH